MKRKFYSWEECMNLREVKSLKKLNHANIVKLKEVIRENDHLYFVFEYMKENLYQLMKDRNKLFPESTVRNIMYQILQGLAFIHKHGFFHRDLKPENLLCMGPELVKIADFGLARETRSRPPYTDYVSTRWYRAPEVLLRSTNYSSPIDTWAIGCIMAEVYTLRPLFPGSSEIDTIFKICQVLGTPKKNDWPEGYQLSGAMSFHWPQCVPNNLKSLIPNAGSEAIQLLRDLLQWDPRKRPTAVQALRYPYFHIGQALGNHHHVQELGNQPKDFSEKSASVLIKPVPPTQPPPKHHGRLSSRPFQGQVPQSMTYPFQADSSLVDHTCQVQEKDKASQLVFPTLIAKTSQQKIATGMESSKMKPKNRRRWGHIVKALRGSDDWDDMADIDFGSLVGSIDLKNEKKRQSDEALCRFESILDLKRTENVALGNAVPIHTSFSSQDTAASQTSTARQHYLKQSRYLPGANIKNTIVANPSKAFTTSDPWPNSSLPVKPLGVVDGVSKRHPGSSGLTTGYIPSFFKKEVGSTGQRVQLVPITDPSPHYSSLKSVRPHPNQPVFNSSSKSPSGLMPRPPPAQPVHGRTDWASKYGGHR
ncbi:serine/threonine-protein kinase ICK isoform X2 [Microcaecilia unicolor]|nr:serine/threonine-protein kinase ICK isoform X2 [Microcaecilia unicolor]